MLANAKELYNSERMLYLLYKPIIITENNTQNYNNVERKINLLLYNRNKCNSLLSQCTK